MSLGLPLFLGLLAGFAQTFCNFGFEVGQRHVQGWISPPPQQPSVHNRQVQQVEKKFQVPLLRSDMDSIQTKNRIQLVYAHGPIVLGNNFWTGNLPFCFVGFGKSFNFTNRLAANVR